MEILLTIIIVTLVLMVGLMNSRINRLEKESFEMGQSLLKIGDAARKTGESLELLEKLLNRLLKGEE